MEICHTFSSPLQFAPLLPKDKCHPNYHRIYILDNPVSNWISGLHYQVRSNIQIKNNLLLIPHFCDRECYTNNQKERTQFVALISTEQDLQTFLLSSTQRCLYLVYVCGDVVPLLC